MTYNVYSIKKKQSKMFCCKIKINKKKKNIKLNIIKYIK